MTEEKLRSARSRVADSGLKPAKAMVAERDSRAYKSRSRNVVKMKLVEDKDVQGFADLREHAYDTLDHILGEDFTQTKPGKAGSRLGHGSRVVTKHAKLGFMVLVPFPVMAVL